MEEQENKEISKRYLHLLRTAYQTISEEEKVIIRRALEVAIEAHKDQRRKSGEPYIYHPIEVARIVSNEIGLGATSIVSALLHDTVEDTDITVEDIQKLFGDKTAVIVDGLTKIKEFDHKTNDKLSDQAENFRKLLLTLSDDVRVLLIKIADRLHNMRTLDAMRPDKQAKIASETISIFAPLAHRLGLFKIKTELEDLSLKYTEPAVYQEIKLQLNQTKKSREEYIEKLCETLKPSLDKIGIPYTIEGRPKSIFSIRRKMKIQDVSFEDVFDKFAIRIIYDFDSNQREEEKNKCWSFYTSITGMYKPFPNRLRDWISTPKSTGYEALHTTVMGLDGKHVEVQIRSVRMHEIAEKGYAAHYKYKHGNTDESGLENWINKLKESLENPEINAIDFVEEFKFNFYSKEIFIFTPKGELKGLPKGATALDFAFEIHTEIGSTCSGIKVNGKIVPLSHQLTTGDKVVVMTNPNQKPKLDWLDYVITSKARSTIKSSLKEDKKEISEQGKEILTRKLRTLKIKLNENVTNKLVNHFNEQTSQDVFYKVGIGVIDSKKIKEFVGVYNSTFYNSIINTFRKRPQMFTSKTEIEANKTDIVVFGNEEEHLPYTLSPCCNPISGDYIFGYVSLTRGMTVHKNDCPNALSLRTNYAARIMRAKWKGDKSTIFAVLLKIKGVDRMGLINDITSLVTKQIKLNITSLNIESIDGAFICTLGVKVINQTQLNKLTQSIKKIESVTSIVRIFNK